MTRRRVAYLHNRLQKRRNDIRVGLRLVPEQFPEGPKVSPERAGGDNVLARLERLHERAERVVRRRAFRPELRGPRDGQRAAQGVELFAEQELGRGVERETGVQVLRVDSCAGGVVGARGSGRVEDRERARRVFLKQLKVGNTVFREERAGECAVLGRGKKRKKKE